MTDQLVSQNILQRIDDLNKIDDSFRALMKGTDTETMMRYIALCSQVQQEMQYLYSLLTVAISERKEAKECVLIGCDAVKEAAELVYRVTSRVPKGYIPCDLFEDLMIFLQDYKTAKI